MLSVVCWDEKAQDAFIASYPARRGEFLRFSTPTIGSSSGEDLYSRRGMPPGSWDTQLLGHLPPICFKIRNVRVEATVTYIYRSRSSPGKLMSSTMAFQWRMSVELENRSPFIHIPQLHTNDHRAPYKRISRPQGTPSGIGGRRNLIIDLWLPGCSCHMSKLGEEDVFEASMEGGSGLLECRISTGYITFIIHHLR